MPKWLDNVGIWFKGVFNQAIAAFKELFSAAFPIAKQIIIGQLKDIALQAVKELDTATLSDTQKREAAFNRIKEYAISNGINARGHLINLALEMALSALRNISE